MYEADIFIMEQTAWANEERARRQTKQMRFGEEIASVYVASAEDMILQKLAWYGLGGGVSDRQWSDVQGMLGAPGSDSGLSVFRPVGRRTYLDRYLAASLRGRRDRSKVI